ncbi:glycoside hydrolase family 45 protein [Aulographum hederae CBS 113979]|uniref:Glycoside hydrolase family 45 protein n=1 Tax=Aulographum hederae CBS 113979 TaxID=1176131 RepID=A0A6G1HFC4_9PEZI|nr:glycoside hydrolase family 45 protein [Aulographum hederae CBS 113979]
MMSISYLLSFATLLAITPTTTLAESYSATITKYGSGDENDSPNCNSDSVECAFYTYPGYAAAVSQNLFGNIRGAGGDPACGTCYSLDLTGSRDSSGNPFTANNSHVVVMVNNLCPANSDNPICAQADLSATNQYGSQIDVNLCIDSGAADAVFGDSGIGLALATATEVSCDEWEGTKKYDSGTGVSGSVGEQGVIGDNGHGNGEAIGGAGKRMAEWWWVGLVAVGVVWGGFAVV